MEPTVRPLVDADIAAVVSFAVDAWAPVFASIEAEMGPGGLPPVYPDWRSAQARGVEGVCRDPDNEVWVAVRDGRPVGFVAVHGGEEGAATAGEIYMIAVAPGHQRSGVGTALLRHAVAELRSAHVELAVIATGGDPGHAPARRLYEKAGFRGVLQVQYYAELVKPEPRR